ncbi:MAG TPA: NADP-dependent phosphogluconate dehydrogenase [Pyrinomonadaceae bacterium]|nr:NADP-dependent phosphogluconate dehydrogenase [Pyrinomonadaceae bacterium]
MDKANFGMIGLGTMGRNFLLNVAEHGIAGVGYDLDAGKRELLLTEGAGMPVDVGKDIPEFLSKLQSPRNIMLLVPAGKIVDAVIADLTPHLSADDLIIDGGNSHFTDTDRRIAELSAKQIGFMGIGISGGEEGARHGASIMPGGTRAHYDRIEDILKAVSAKVDGEPCVAYMGTGSAGHFVKMVHNGIEYGLMEIISETYDYFRRAKGLSASEIAEVFAKWNTTELNSFLIEITAIVLSKVDPGTGKFLVDEVLDEAGQKGTGKWTSQAALDLGIPIPTIDSAVSMRQISALRSVRDAVGGVFGKDLTDTSSPIEETEMHHALTAAFIITYAQGMSLLQAASNEMSYGFDLAAISKIWRGGCIIRSAMLEEMRRAFTETPSLANLMVDARFSEMLKRSGGGLRKMVSACLRHGIPALGLSSASNYYDAFRAEKLPANLIQAQRDYFGAHTYKRIDKEGIFHSPDWDVNAKDAGGSGR